VRVCALAELVPGEIRMVPGRPIVVLRGSGGGAGTEVYAFGSTCTHLRAPLRTGTVRDGCLQCPLHGARFELSTGAVRRGPARRALPVYPVVIEAGQVYVDPRPRPPPRRRWWSWPR
jgi:3-phenylpropionate/trans-cinnamate dioxygenase ferredoxin component